MLENIPTLSALLKALQQVPYLASKNLYRVASYFLHMDDAKTEQFCKVLLNTKKNLAQCQMCFCWKEKNDSCLFCSSAKRDQSVICVLESWYELLTIEQTRGFDGVYHVLGGVICPLEGIGPEDLTIDQLIARADKGVSEIILATSQTPEGEATAAYIANRLKNKEQVKISCLARGLPVGSTLGGMDRLTVFKALSERRQFN